MYGLILTLHVLTLMLVIGTLFVKSLIVVFSLTFKRSGEDRGCTVDSA